MAQWPPAPGERFAPLPDEDAVTAVIDVAFWASLRREEGYAPRISLALLPPAEANQPLVFAHRIPLSAVGLARLAPAVERPGIHLGVWPDAHGLVVWGTARGVPRYCLVLEVVAAGLLVLKYRRADDAAKFVNVAVLEGDEVKLVDHGAPRASATALNPVLVGLRALTAFGGDGPDLLVQLAVSMRAHRRGGTLLVVPAHDDGWRASVVRSIPYAVTPPFRELAALARADVEARGDPAWSEASRWAVDAVAGLTAVDGATVVTDELDVLAFGAKIARRPESPQVERALATEPVAGRVGEVVALSQLGGTRHLSAAQFVHDQRDAAAFVASQDGRFTVFTWSAADAMVSAHRIEALLL
jgi:hypothetical protein